MVDPCWDVGFGFAACALECGGEAGARSGGGVRREAAEAAVGTKESQRGAGER